MRYFLELSFLGTNYHGWQKQKNAHSVQQELENALKILFRKDVETTGCGRTDTGVHARKFFAHFDAEELLPKNSPRKINKSTIREINNSSFIYHLNSLFPSDISIINVFPVNDDAHARYDATSRTYEYIITQRKDALLHGLSFHFEYDLDIKEMNHFAKLLLGKHDFGCFSKSRTQVKTNICTVKEAKWKQEEHKFIFQITADRFLRNMVRAIVGTLLDAGEKRISETDFKKILASKNRSNAGVSVPASGLYLCEIKYPFIK
ncbi:MAG: tRNA pseudouridine(38-40) synthase TruA [Bacteroidia bacterium]|nr:tRNA pseudouridine(38-40) synthase TruA [Bacteroidia bacterium]